MKINVLDHGYVELIDHMGSDETVVEAARMSTGKGFQGWDQDARLLEFLWENQHTSPFEMCELHIEVQAPIFVFREWHRHRTQSYNEFSARYAQMPNIHYLPQPERVQKQSKTNKQGSAESVDLVSATSWCAAWQDHQDDIYRGYQQAIDQGIAKEIARINTPVSRYSKMRAKTDLLNWLRFLGLRMAPNAQYEIREFANAVAKIVQQLWPRTYALFEEHSLHGVRLSRSEVERLRFFINNPNALLLPSLRKKLGMDQ